MVTWTSNAAVDALLAGVPVFCTGDCAASVMGRSDPINIEYPYYPDKGHNIRAMVGGSDFGWATRMPCHELQPREGVKCECPDFTEPTPEQIAEREREMAMIFAAAIAARALIEGDGKDYGDVECPKCQGVIDYTKSSVNGHVCARCRTPDCLFFME